MTKPIRILLSWVGQTDINASKHINGVGEGPVAQAAQFEKFDSILLLSNYGDTESHEFVRWLSEKTDTKIDLKTVKLSSPVNFGEIYTEVILRIKQAQNEFGEGARFTFHLSPGTPAMAAVWIIVAKTRFAARLLESSRDYGVGIATVPFDISAEFIPALLKAPDEDLRRLASGEASISPSFSSIISKSSEMRDVLLRAQKVVSRSIPVLIEGESGTGKELLARAIHEAGVQKSEPFIAVNCGAIPTELAESEFFGHKKGSFTGANEDRVGHFEAAGKGTLFLNELGELPLEMQVKLLRVLQDGQLVRVGESKPIKTHARIIAATNLSLASQVSKGKFREDLFYRLAVAIIQLPPLRERKGDFTLLADHLLKLINEQCAAETNWQRKSMSANARNILIKHNWPGNIRELQNTLMRAAVWSHGEVIGVDDVNQSLLVMESSKSDTVLNRDVSKGIDLRGIIKEVVTHYLKAALIAAKGNRSTAAKLLNMSNYQTLNNWIEKYDVK